MATRGFEASETIDRPIEEVWTLLTDFRRAPEWMTEVVRIEHDPSVPLGPGATLATHVRRSKSPMATEIVAWSPPLQMVLRSRQGGITAVYSYRCAGADGGTRVTLDARCSADGLFWRLLHPLIAAMMKRADGGQLAALKDLAER